MLIIEDIFVICRWVSRTFHAHFDGKNYTNVEKTTTSLNIDIFMLTKEHVAMNV